MESASDSHLDDGLAAAYNDFLREVGCKFVGDRPGRELVTYSRVCWDGSSNGYDQRFYPTFEFLMISAGYSFHCPAFGRQGFELLWQLITRAPNAGWLLDIVRLTTSWSEERRETQSDQQSGESETVLLEVLKRVVARCSLSEYPSESDGDFT